MLADVATGCRTIYQPTFYWPFAAGGLFLMAMALLLRNRIEEARRHWVYLVAGGAALWTIVAGASTYADHAQAANAIRTHAALVAEGRVTNFQPLSLFAHGEESFTVNGVRFAYSDAVVSGGFNRTSGRGGPMREGLPVRIYYLPNHGTDFFDGSPVNLIVRIDSCF